jgi:hypothetical protein
MADLLVKEKENDIYQSPVKVVFLLVFEVGSAFLMSFYFRQTIVDFSIQKLVFFLIGLSLFLIFSFFTSLLVEGFIWSSLGVGLSIAASFAVFYDYFSSILVFFGLIIFLIFLWAVSELRSAAADSLKIRFFHLAKVFLAKAVLAVALALTIFCYFLLPFDGFPLSFKNFQFLLKSNEKLVAVFIPNFSFEKTLKEILSEKLPAEIKGTGLEEIIFLGFKINAADPVDKIIFDSLKTKFVQMNERTQKIIIISLFVCLFLIIQFLFIVLRWIFPIILFLIYLFLSAVNFVAIKLESTSKETLSI